MTQGEQAVKRMAELDSQRGATGKQNPKRAKVVETEVGAPPNSRAGEVILPDSGFLTDADLAAQRLEQSAQMKKQAEQRLAMDDAEALSAWTLGEHGNQDGLRQLRTYQHHRPQPERRLRRYAQGARSLTPEGLCR